LPAVNKMPGGGSPGHTVEFRDGRRYDGLRIMPLKRTFRESLQPCRNE